VICSDLRYSGKSPQLTANQHKLLQITIHQYEEAHPGISSLLTTYNNLIYRRETALQGDSISVKAF